MHRRMMLKLLALLPFVRRSPRPMEPAKVVFHPKAEWLDTIEFHPLPASDIAVSYGRAAAKVRDEIIRGLIVPKHIMCKPNEVDTARKIIEATS